MTQLNPASEAYSARAGASKQAGNSSVSHDHVAPGFSVPCLHGGAADGCAACGVRLFSVCAVLKQDELEALEALSSVVLFSPKDALFQQDAPATHVFNVTEGVVRLYKLLPDGRRQIVGFALPGDFLGVALLDRYGVSGEAVTGVTACKFSRKSYAAYVDAHPHLLRRLHEFASHELSLAQDQMVILGRRSAEERVAAFLVSLRDRMRRIGHTSVTLPLPMSRQNIADFLGLTIETVSRTFTKLAKAKTLLVVPDGVRITHAERLETLAAG